MALTLSGSTDTGYGVAGDTNGVRVNINNVTKATFDASGNLGIGVTPSAWSGTGQRALQVGSGSSGVANFAGSGTKTILCNNEYFNGSTNVYINNGYAQALVLDENGGYQFLATTSGTAGNAITWATVMTLSSGGTLNVTANSGNNASAFTTQTWDWYCAVMYNKDTTGNNLFIEFKTEGTPSQRGSITYNRGGGVVAYSTTSDYRAKDIEGPVVGALGVINELHVYTGRMKGATISRPMFIAHEAQEVLPYAVTGEKDAVDDEGKPVMQSMDHQILVPLLTAAIQELAAEVAALKAK